MMEPPAGKPYNVYRSAEGAPADGASGPAGPPPLGPRRDRPSRRRPPRRGRGGLILLLVILAALVLAAVAVAVVRPFGGDAKEAQASTAQQGGGELATTQATSTPTASPTSAASTTPTPAPTATPKSFTVTAGGDTMGGFAVSGVVGSIGSRLFKSIAPAFKACDYGFVNLESPLTRGGDPQGWKDVVIKGNPALAPAMAKSGINVVTLANNHAGDQGDSGLLDTLKYCAKSHIAVVGAGRDISRARRGVILKKNGVRVAYLGFTDVLPVGYPATSTSPGTSPGRANISAVKKAIRTAAGKSDFVVVGWHWNLEYKTAPTSLELGEGHAAIDAGANLVFAHHPHVLDGVQAYHHGLICYSLGNLVFSGFGGTGAQTMLVKTKVTKHAIDAQLIPVQVNSVGIPTVAHGGMAAAILARVKRLSASLGTKVKIANGKGYVHVKR
jgi:poly-gamma-glutamate capsule biosynthesis protein CapA/YwtB (metallophosphatase superfamily)